MKKFLKEFKEFAMRGNVLDMAVGVVIGGAFGKITTSLVNDIIMPFISMLTGGVDFTQWKWVLKEVVEGDTVTQISVNYGNLIAVILDFIVIAFSIFCMLKVVNGLHRKKEEAQEEAPAEPEPSKEERLLAEIRDILKDR